MPILGLSIAAAVFFIFGGIGLIRLLVELLLTYFRFGAHAAAEFDRGQIIFELAAYDEGANVSYMGLSGSHIGHKETMKNTASVLGRIYDGIEYRGYAMRMASRKMPCCDRSVLHALSWLTGSPVHPHNKRIQQIQPGCQKVCGEHPSSPRGR